MVSRRRFISGTAGLAFASLLSGCSGASEETLKVSILQDSVPSEVLQNFRGQLESPVDFQLVSQIRTLFQQLQQWQKAPESSGFSLDALLPWVNAEDAQRPDNLVSLGDYWLESVIAQDLISPLTLPTQTLDKLPQSWQQFVTRSDNGQIADTSASSATSSAPFWAAPYKVQTLVIVYRQSAYPDASRDNSPFTSWQDLLQPNLREQVALPEHPRLVLGLIQKLRSDSFNLPVESADNIRELARQLTEPFTELNAQVKTYDSTNSLKSLINKDVQVAVAWSGEVSSALRRYQDLRVAVPQEGSLLSADLWVQPKGVKITDAAIQWIDFCWQRNPATQISVSGRGISPVFLTADAELPSALSETIVPLSTAQVSEPLLPIPADQQAAYFELWQQLRSS